MKINQRIFDYADPEKVMEKQEFEKHSVEIYKLNDYPDIMTEFTNKGKFAVWSSINGNDYHLYVEEGYYNKVTDLYTQKVNGIWLDFWDKCEKISNKFRWVVFPLTLLVVIAVFLISRFVPSISTYIIIGLAVVFFAAVLIYRRFANKAFTDANRESVQLIKDYLGEKKFEKLLENQRNYLDEFFHYEDNTDQDDYEQDVKELEATEIQDTDTSEIESEAEVAELEPQDENKNSEE